MSLVTGVDVSHWQTPSAQLANQRAAFGDRFAIVKGADGLGKDPASRAHLANFGRVGLALGSYIFYRSAKDPAAQARELLEATAGLTLTMGLWLDYENGSTADRPDDLLTFLTTLDAGFAGTVGIYTGPSWWKATIGDDHRFARFPLWLAQYPNRYKDASTYPTTITPTVPAPWSHVSIWQFSDGGGQLDRNVCTAETFDTITGHHEPAPIPKGPLMALTDKEQTELLDKVRDLHADYAVSREAGTTGPKDNGTKRWQIGKIFNAVVRVGAHDRAANDALGKGG